MRITLRYILPLLIFIALIIFLCKGLYTNKSAENENLADAFAQKISSISPSNSAEKSRRDFSLKSLLEPNKTLTQDIFKGKVSILNVWASWCGPCRAEQETLVTLSKQTASTFWVGLNINDTMEEAQRVLQIYGNPYQDIIFDPQGRLAINLGIRGTPALLVLDKNGSVQYRHYGPVNQLIWEQEILPLIKSLEEA